MYTFDDLQTSDFWQVTGLFDEPTICKTKVVIGGYANDYIFMPTQKPKSHVVVNRIERLENLELSPVGMKTSNFIGLTQADIDEHNRQEIFAVLQNYAHFSPSTWERSCQLASMLRHYKVIKDVYVIGEQLIVSFEIPDLMQDYWDHKQRQGVSYKVLTRNNAIVSTTIEQATIIALTGNGINEQGYTQSINALVEHCKQMNERD